MSNNTLGELVNLKQTEYVDDYQCQFQFLLAITHDLKPKPQVGLFSVRLVDELRIEVDLQQPQNLGVSMNMDQALE